MFYDTTQTMAQSFRIPRCQSLRQEGEVAIVFDSTSGQDSRVQSMCGLCTISSLWHCGTLFMLSFSGSMSCIHFFMFPRGGRDRTFAVKARIPQRGAISVACSRCHRIKSKEEPTTF